MLACILSWGLACSDSQNGSNPPPPPTADAARDVANNDTASDAGSTPTDAADADTKVADDASPDRPADATADRSADAAADPTIDAASDRSLDGSSADQSSDSSTSDISIDRSLDDAADDTTGDVPIADQGGTSDSDAPPLKATCSVDQPCTGGNCSGTSCDLNWYCFAHFAPHPCPLDIVPYCGCDGKTYYFPATCPEVPYEHAGECGDGVNCDPGDVRCTQQEPDCGTGKVASVVGGCYGPCVPITSCRCVFPFECPQRDKYDCNPDRRCDFSMNQ
jgi:hypothetical protein